MRSKYRRYQVTAASITLNAGSDQVGITADFEGGFVLVVASLSTNVGVGQWATTQVKVDGMVQGAGGAAWQPGQNLQVPTSEIVRVPQGRHRISLVTSAGVPFPAGGSNIVFTVAEMPG